MNHQVSQETIDATRRLEEGNRLPDGELYTTLTEPPARSSGNFLATLYHKTLGECKVDLARWMQLMQRYVNRHRNNGDDVTALRGNLTRELSSTSMSTKTFMKGLELLGVTSAKITVTLTREGGQQTVHEVDLGIKQTEPA